MESFIGLGKTLCGFAPISKLFIDALINVAKQTRDPIQVICSRNQIECQSLKGGYVNGWTTEKFAKYMALNASTNVYLCRDHGGPWQNSQDINKSFDLAMENALQSFYRDINSEFHFIHIDPSIFHEGIFELKAYIQRTKGLIDKCLEYTKKNSRRIFLEVGAEGNDSEIGKESEFKEFVEEIINFCLE